MKFEFVDYKAMIIISAFKNYKWGWFNWLFSNKKLIVLIAVTIAAYIILWKI